MKKNTWLAGLFIGLALPAATAQDVAKEPGAVAALNKMGAYLRNLKSFQVKAQVTDEEVLNDGQKLTYERTTEILAQLPNRLYAKVIGDRSDNVFFYNGTTFTLFQPSAGYYATVNAPPTLAKLAEVAYDKYNIELPLEDLFLWGSDKVDTSTLTGAFDAGPATVDGLTCEHYAFRQPGLDWQIWIQLGDHPLPRKIVLTTLTDDARPQHIAVYSWNLAPSYNDAAFTFDPPENAKKIVFASAQSGAGNK